MNPHSIRFRLLEWYGLNGRHPGLWRVHAALRNLLKADVDAELEVERQGLRWVLNPSDFPQTALFWLGESDRWDLHHARSFVRPGAVIFDVGANFGYYSLMLASALGGNCEVHAFEPVSETYAKLVRHIELNGLGCIHPHRLALSDAPGTASMHNPIGHSGAAYLEPGTGDVTLSTLDAFVAEHRLKRLDFIKIDVEGFEERVLRGGAGALSRFRPVLLIEFMPTTLSRAGSSVRKVAQFLTAQGYVLRQASRERLVPLVLREDPGYLVNGFCIPAKA